MSEEKDSYSILYIMGRGYSGSTTLDLILGNHKEIQSVGELTSGFSSSKDSRLCSCYSLLDECVFWGTVRQRLQQQYPETSLDEYGRMIRYMARFYRIPQIRTDTGLPSWFYKVYDPMTHDLYDLISQESQKSYVVDSSKEMGYAYYLLTRFSSRTKIIHLVRDGRGVMWSYLRRLRSGQPFQFLRRYYSSRSYWIFMVLSALSWNFGNMIGIFLRLFNKDKILLVRYEDLCNNPGEEFSRIGNFIGLDFTEIIRRIENSDPFNIGHTVGGNRMRHNESGQFIFQPDSTWQNHLPKRYSILFVLLSFPLLIYLGYFKK